MQTIPKGFRGNIYHNIYVDDQIVSQEDGITVTIKDADTDELMAGGYATTYGTGEASFKIPFSITTIDRRLSVTWEYVVENEPVSIEEFYAVETQYSTTTETIDFLGLGNNSSDLNFYEPEEIESAEKIARTIIDGYTGQKFNKYYGFQEAWGVGSDAIELVERMITLDKVWEDGQLVIDNTGDPVYNNFGFDLEITPTGKAIRIINTGWDVRYDNQVDPTVLYYGRFRDNTRYRFRGQIGYKYVPNDIKIASMMLIGDILANDFNWRNKYLKKVDLSEISFEMHDGAFNGTGNVAVDNILDQYRNINIMVI